MQRYLTPKETNALKLLKYAESLAEASPKRLAGTLSMPIEAVMAMERAKVARPYLVERDVGTGQCRVHFTLQQLYRYVEFVCEMCGLDVQLDGSIKTNDGRTLTLEEIH